ncbi:MAG TPA: GNAT family N-acetyltransferase [Longimicrobiales bacterium]
MAVDHLIIRAATRDDVPAIVAMLADDDLGSTREEAAATIPQSYYDAFDAIERDANNLILVACDREEVVGTLQLTFTPGLSYRGGWRATVESVRAARTRRGRGIGTALMKRALELARERQCVLLQLATHKSRTAAQRFYERLGFQASHIGMKIQVQ